MVERSGLGTGLKTLILGALAVVAMAVTAVVWQGRPVPAPPVEIAEPESVAAAPAPAAPLPAAPPAKPATATSASPKPPSFDVVRVEPDGAALVAGRAEAGQDVAVLIDGAQAALAHADPQGRFVVFLSLASSTDARVMTLELRPVAGAAVPSSDQVLLAPTVPAEAPPDPVVEAMAAAPAAVPPAEAAPAEAEAEPALAEAEASAAAPAAPVADATAPDPAQTPVPAETPDPAKTADPAESGVASADPAAPPGTAPPSALVVADAPSAAPDAQERSNAAPTPPQTSVADADPAPPSAPPTPVQPAAPISVAPAAPAAILLSGDTARVLQSPDGTASPPGTISIDTISYTSGGSVALSGRGDAGAFVRVYLNNGAVMETAIGPDGTWGGTLPVVAPGVYTLRVDQVSAQGQVTSRFETPFQREDPQALAAPVAVTQGESGAAVQPGKVSITVQPGFTLWQIARETYGDGMLFVRVYDANKALIRDPDLIYPGQVFTVPQPD